MSAGSNTQTGFTGIRLSTHNNGSGQMWKAGSAYGAWGGPNSLNIYCSNGPIAFHPNGIANALFLAGGNVGIGTTTPGAKLDVVGGAVRVGGREVINASGQALYA